MISRPSHDAPRVSVILPVYNAEPYLAEAVQSILDQSFTDFEFLIHDDGSTDGSLAILQDFAARDARIRVTSGPNQGVGVVPGLLIADARGALIARMDADDVCLPQRLEKQVAFLEAHPDHVMVAGWGLTMDAEGRFIAPGKLPVTHEDIDGRHLRGLTTILQSAVTMRTKALQAAGGYNPEFPNAEDLELWLRLAEVGKIANLPEVVIRIRIHDQSLSAVKQQQQADYCRRACEAAWARRGITSPFDHKPWRMEDTRASRRDFFLKYGWDAWNWGYRDTWRHYALQAVTTDPLSVNAWKLLVFGALRRPPPGKYVLEEQ